MQSKRPLLEVLEAKHSPKSMIKKKPRVIFYGLGTTPQIEMGELQVDQPMIDPC